MGEIVRISVCVYKLETGLLNADHDYIYSLAGCQSYKKFWGRSCMDARVSKAILYLHRNNMAGYFVKNKEELLQLMASFMKKGETVGCGDSVTLEELGVFEFVRRGDFVFYDKHQIGLTPEE